MKKALLFLVIIIPCLLIAQPLKVQSPVRFLALGDSYTIGQSVLPSQNWPNQLKDSLAVRNIITDTLRIIATTGWRTDNLLAAITNQGLDSVHFNLVRLLIGVNNQYQGTPLSQYYAQFPQLVDSAIRYAGGDTSHVFILSIPDYAYTPFGIQTGDTAQISMQIDTYNLINKQIADSFHIKYFNITPISRMGLAQPDLVDTIDGLHPSPLQYSLWVKLMLQSIDSADAVSTAIATIANDNKMLLYPNPATNEVTITIDNLTANTTIQIFNALGQLMITQKPITLSTTIPVSNLSAGLYTVRISANGQQMERKIIKE